MASAEVVLTEMVKWRNATGRDAPTEMVKRRNRRNATGLDIPTEMVKRRNAVTQESIDQKGRSGLRGRPEIGGKQKANEGMMHMAPYLKARKNSSSERALERPTKIAQWGQTSTTSENGNMQSN
jgi:hypothetical protein